MLSLSLGFLLILLTWYSSYGPFLLPFTIDPDTSHFVTDINESEFVHSIIAYPLLKSIPDASTEGEGAGKEAG